MDCPMEADDDDDYYFMCAIDHIKIIAQFLPCLKAK